MSIHLLRQVIVAGALLIVTCAGAAPLSLDQAMDLAVQRSQSARSARAGAMSAAEMARAAGQQADPMLSFGIDNLPATGPNRFSAAAEDMTMKRIGISQEWVSADKRAASDAHGVRPHDGAAMGRRYAPRRGGPTVVLVGAPDFPSHRCRISSAPWGA